MLKNYLKTALRNLWKNKAFSAINILGLVLGLACSLLIMLWVNEEYKVDAFHKNGSQLYSVYEQQFRDNEVDAFHGGPGLMAAEMKRVLPDVQYASGYAWDDLATFEVNGKIIKETGNHAGEDFFKMFSYPLLAGNVNTALLNLEDIAISQKMAEDFFGSPAAAIGKTIRYQNSKDMKVTAVFANVPKNSSIQFDYLINWKQFLVDEDWAKDWTNNGPSTLIMLRAGVDPKEFEKKIRRFLDKYNNEQTARSYIRLGIQRWDDMYLHSKFDKRGVLSGGRIQYVNLFSIVAIFILLIACINFMNLTTARSVKRAREIGVRKVVGALRFSLIRQFIGEALVIVFIAVLLSLALVGMILPLFNQLTSKNIILPFHEPIFWLVMFALLLVTGFVAGSYPALYLSSFRPVLVLKGTLKFSRSALWFRKGLVVFQFMLSILLIIGTIAISRQVNYIQHTNLGYDRDNLLYVPLEGDLPGKYELFKQLALKEPGIKAVTRMINLPTNLHNGTSGVSWDGKDPNQEVDFTQTAVGYDFISSLHLQMTEGRDFSKSFATDTAGFIVNEAALAIIGYKDPVGKPLLFWKQKGTIVGVMKDFHLNSLHTTIKPLVLRLGEKLDYGNALIKISGSKTQETLAELRKICNTLNPKFPFTYQFADEEYQKLYTSEQLVSRLTQYFSFLAIFISCLGLLGLVLFSSEQRRSEFGIRKVLGASPVSLFGLLSKEFLWLVLIALVIATPLAWLSVHQWLQNFEYRTDVPWWIYVLAGAVAILIALITVSWQAIRAAHTNPVTSLRSE